ncbi:MAG: inositol monophosphatase family protein [Verrucomicrobiota bacterium]
MKLIEQKRALSAAVAAARAAGKLMRQNLRAPKKINEIMQHDIKLELDVRCQALIERRLRTAFPKIALLGEEGVAGDPAAAQRWVVDPIDGTVNFAYGIPHACVSIALQERVSGSSASRESKQYDGFESQVAVIYEPFTDELWTAIRGQSAWLNGRRIHVSDRADLREAILTLGFSKSKKVLREMLPQIERLVNRVRKIRIMGAAALCLTYVASGRMDVYYERNIRLWDIAAGALIIECAGGEFLCQAGRPDHFYDIVASNGILGKKALRVINQKG